MRQDVKLSGTSEARGRNGWFVPREALIYSVEDGFRTGTAYGPGFVLSIYSKTRGEMPPIMLDLSADDADTLGGLLPSPVLRRILEVAQIPSEILTEEAARDLAVSALARIRELATEALEGKR